jgi:hypothetical protein
MKKTKIRRPRISPEVPKAITYLHLAHPDWTGEKIWRELEHYSDRQWCVPSLRATQKMFAKVKAETKNPEFQWKETAWQLGILGNKELSPFSAEAIAAIIEVQFWLERVKDKPNIATSSIAEWTESFTNGKMTTKIWPLTVREAHWIARLYKVRYILSEPERLYFLIHERGVQPPKNTNRKKMYELFAKAGVPLRRSLIENPSKLWETAKTYADYQRLCELASMNFDTSRLDEALRTGSIGKMKYDLFSEYKAKSEHTENQASE